MKLVVDQQTRLRMENFFKNYEIANRIQCANYERKHTIGGDKESKCRFCKKEPSETTFNYDSHVIPQLLGNRHILSNFECDSCNQLFSNYEDSLASFIGAFRTVGQVRGQKGKGIPKFKDKNTGLTIYNKDGKVTIDVLESSLDREISFDEENKSLTISTKKQTYIPLDVYRSLLKIALSLISEDEILKYEETFRFLLKKSDEFREHNFPFAQLIVYFVPINFAEKPFAALFKKRVGREREPVFTHSLAIAFKNHLYQIFLPFHTDDTWMYDGKTKVSLPIVPLVVNQELFPNGVNYGFSVIDLSSVEKKKAEADQLKIKFDNQI